MLTNDTKRVTAWFMTFTDIIDLWPSVHELAADLGLPAKNVRRWIDTSSIPAEWFLAVQQAAAARGFKQVTVESLSEAAHCRRLARIANDTAQQSEAA